MLWSKLLCLRIYSCHLCFLHQIVLSMLLTSLAHTNTSSFVTFYVQLLFSILYHIHISNAYNSFILTLVNFRVSAVYSATFQTVLFITSLLTIFFLVHEQCLAHCNSCSYVLSSISIIWYPPYSSSDTICFWQCLTNHHKSLLVDLHFLTQIPVSPFYSNICQNCH